MSSVSHLQKVLKGTKAWADVEKKLAHADSQTKGAVFEHLTKKFLQFEPRYTSRLKHVWLLKEVPTAVAEKLKLPKTDQGIDLICETHDGEFWSVQCKYISDADETISHRQIATFGSLSFGLAKNISYALVATTAGGYAKIYRTENKIGFILIDQWRKLGPDFFTFAGGDRKPQAPPKLTPRRHQTQAIRSAERHFLKAKETRGKLVFPCGAGKSLAGYWIARKFAAKSIVVAVPSLALVKQTLETWLAQASADNIKLRWLCVCSDESIGKNDDVAIHTQDLGVPCVTDPVQISGWLKQNKNHAKVIFTTYQSARALGDAVKRASTALDLGILDEAHKTVGANDKLFSYLLYDKNVKIRRRIFMTATERRYRGSSDDIVSMDDVDLFGDTFEHISFAHAVEADILSDYKIVTLAISNQDIADAVGANSLSKDGVEARSYAALVALRKAMRRYPIKHAVSFHGSIAKAEDFKTQQDLFSQQHPEFSPLETFHVSGAMPTARRSKIIHEFAKSPASLITNAKCLTEGIDVPKIDAVLFADPRRSTVDIVQAVGRALRKSPGKKSGYVILPLFTGDSTGDAILESDEFKEVIQTLRALASNDERIVEYFRDVSKGNRPRGKLIEFDLDVKATADFDAETLVRELELRTWNRLAKLNWRPFEEAREFVRGLGLRSTAEWRKFSQTPQKPFDIPSAPNDIYDKNGWLSWGDWLGSDRLATNQILYWDFARARKFVHGLKLKSTEEWQEYCKGKMPHKGLLPSGMPATPRRTYAERGWISMGDWLGSGFIATSLRNYRDIESAKKFVHKLKLKTNDEWRAYCKRYRNNSKKLPSDIPENPQIVYFNKGWKGLGDWLGTGVIAASKREYQKFANARKFVHSLKLKNNQEWRAYSKGEMPHKPKLPADIPATPDVSYRRTGEWKNWGDWLGTGYIHPSRRNYRPFLLARAYVRKLGIKNQQEWLSYTKDQLPGRLARPADIPANPETVYKGKGWINLGDWLGTGTIAPHQRKFRTFDQAKMFVQALGLHSNKQWREFCRTGKRPADMPSNPEKTYTEDWRGWPDFLGTAKRKPAKKRR
jgi:superfamily II DNA or RNA helicase